MAEEVRGTSVAASHAPTERWILGRYQSLELIGEGGEGRVWHALDRVTGARVAVKVRAIRDEHDRRWVAEEAELLRHMRPHPALAVIREVHVDEAAAYLVTEWIEGTRLDVLVTERGDPGLPYEDAAEIVDEVAWALEHLHGHDPPIVHGDVKPANVIVRPGGGVALVDFGQSLRRGRASRGQVTSRFAAPEVRGNVPLSVAADVYGLAATTYALLVGAPPQFGLRPVWIGLDPRVAASVDRALATGLHVDPSARPASVADLMSRLPRREVSGRSSGPTNLPTADGTFIGRPRETATVRRALHRARVVSLIGIGGVGKTRLALEVGWRSVIDFPDGVWFVELGGVRADEVPARVAAVLPGSVAPGSLVSALATSRALLVLNTCEEVRAACARLCAELMAQCADLRMLVASRLVLGVPGERVIRLEPLAVNAGSSAGLKLFWNRARTADPGLVRRGANARAALELCQRIGGLPLALELVAFAASEREPKDILAELGDGSWGLEGVLRWTEATLTEAERRLFRRVAALPGGCEVATAMAVCVGKGLDGTEVQDVLWRLVERGLLDAEEQEGRLRYRMLDPVREYALRRLRDSGEQEWVERRILRWALARCSVYAKDLPDGDPDTAREVQAEFANLLSVTRARVDAEDPDALGLAAALGHAMPVGYEEQMLPVLERAVGLAPGWSQATAACLAARSMTLRRLQRIEDASIRASELLEAARRAHDGRWESWGLSWMARLRHAQGDPDAARGLYQELEAWASQQGDPVHRAEALAGLGAVEVWKGDAQRALELLGRAKEVYRARGLLDRMRNVLDHEGAVHLYRLGTYDVAAECFREAVEVARRLHSPFHAAIHRLRLSQALLGGGRTEEAEGHAREAVALFRRAGLRMQEGLGLHMLGQVKIAQGDLEAAGRHLHRALALREPLEDWSGPASICSTLARLYRLQGDLERSAGVARDALDRHQRAGLPLLEDAIWAIFEAGLTLAAAGHEAALGLLAFVDQRVAAHEAAIPPGRRSDLDEVLGGRVSPADLPQGLPDAAGLAERALSDLLRAPTRLRADSGRTPYNM